jgi:flavin reductase
MPRSNTIVRSGETRQERPVPALSVRAAEADIRTQFLDGMSRAAFCVSVVTTDGPAGCSGVTISAMSSVSADGNRPTILVCIHHQSRTAAAILENGTFCVNVLREDQSHIADRFGGRVQLEDGDKFAGAGWVKGSSRAPRLADAVAAFDCCVASAERVGTHHIFIGEVQSVTTGSGTALIYADRAYGKAQRIETARQKKSFVETFRTICQSCFSNGHREAR